MQYVFAFALGFYLSSQGMGIDTPQYWIITALFIGYLACERLGV